MLDLEVVVPLAAFLGDTQDLVMQATVVATVAAAAHATVGLQLLVEGTVVTDPAVDHANTLE